MDCYSCKHRRDLPGSCHSACHYLAEQDKTLTLIAFAIVAEGKHDFGPIAFEPHGMKNGWCNWPLDFDPVWVKHCNFYEGK